MKRIMIMKTEIEIDQSQIDAYISSGLVKTQEEAEEMFCKVMRESVPRDVREGQKISVSLSKNYNLNLRR